MTETREVWDEPGNSSSKILEAKSLEHSKRTLLSLNV